MNDYKFNRVNELLGESVIYEAKKTKIKLSLDDGSKKEMEFDGSLNDAKKKFSGKKVKTIRKSKSGDIIGEAVIVNVEELNETKETDYVKKFPGQLKSIFSALKNPTFNKGPIEYSFPKSKYFDKDVIKAFLDYFKEKGYKVEIGTDYPNILYFDRDVASKLIKKEKLDESMDDEVHTFDTPMDMFRQIYKESQAIYVKEKNGKIEGRHNPKPKKDWILVDGFTAARAIKLYEAATDEQKAKIDKLSLTRFLNGIWKTKKVNESEETTFKVNKELIVSESLPQYFETMLWSSTDMDSGEPLDKEYDVKDISKGLKDSSKKDLLTFAEYCEKNCAKELEEYLEEEGYESFGHDVWLSRNGHGAGFFDRGNGYKALQKASKTLGEVDPMVSKGKIVA